MLAAYRAARPIELCCPGHRGGRQADAETVRLLGRKAFEHDVTQVPGIDDLLMPAGPIVEAQRLAADLWGARETHFLVNGTSSGIHAAMLTVCAAGDLLGIPRAAHRSVVEGLILSGAMPRWIPCSVDPVFGCALPPTEAAVLEAARGARMIVLTRPTFYGDVAGLTWVHSLASYDTILLVDEAWGAHLGFHPETPPGACRAGADLVVNSTHKTAGALSGGSMLHLCSGRVDGERLASAVRMLTTTSPYYGTLASLDGARRNLAVHALERVSAILAATRRTREELAAIPGIDVAGPERSERFEAVSAFDETRLCFSALKGGLTGTEVAEALRREHGIQVEHAEERCVVAQLCGDVDAAASVALVAALRDILLSSRERTYAGSSAQTVRRGGGALTGTHAGVRARQREFPVREVAPPIVPESAMSPREAFQSPHARVCLEQAAGRVAAEMVCPYPPGMPLLCYGERITAEIVDVLKTLRSQQIRLQGCADGSLSTLAVVR